MLEYNKNMVSTDFHAITVTQYWHSLSDSVSYFICKDLLMFLERQPVHVCCLFSDDLFPWNRHASLSFVHVHGDDEACLDLR